jgi:hypothetical protein
MSCKSSLCLRCANVYVYNWISQVSRRLHEGVIYRHIVLTMPAMLRQTFYQHARRVLSAFMRCGVWCLDSAFSRGSGRALTGGDISESFGLPSVGFWYSRGCLSRRGQGRGAGGCAPEYHRDEQRCERQLGGQHTSRITPRARECGTACPSRVRSRCASKAHMVRRQTMRHSHYASASATVP